MFYSKKLDQILRFGDVLQGYVLASAAIKKPNSRDYSIDVKSPNYCAVLTPCCSIEEGMILLSPLIRVLGDFFNNPYFKEDLTRINRKMKPEQKFAPEVWNEFSLEKKEEIESKGKQQYSNVNHFIYEENELFDKYHLKKRDMGYYMIDFRRTYRLKCPMIKRDEEMKEKDKAILESKCLQLSKKTREDLRMKLSYYYYRSPDNV